MKKLLALSLTLATSALAVTHISLAGGSTTTISPSREDVVVSCSLSSVANACQIKTDKSSGFFYVEQGGNRVTQFYYHDSDMMKTYNKLKAEGICP
jgi:hypothetical protein